MISSGLYEENFSYVTEKLSMKLEISELGEYNIA
jgi:hypothetical protein